VLLSTTVANETAKCNESHVCELALTVSELDVSHSVHIKFCHCRTLLVCYDTLPKDMLTFQPEKLISPVSSVV